MEKNKNISLDELFARAKGEEPVISQEDVHAIVSSATSPMQSVQQTTSFISRKGFIMTGLGLVGATAALVGYLTMGSGQLPQGSGQWSVASGQLGNGGSGMGNEKIETTTPTSEPKKDSKEPKEVKVDKEVIVKIGGNDGGRRGPKFDGPHTPDGKLMAPLEVEKVGIVQAKEADLPKLGLYKAPNGDILFKASENGGRGMTIAIPAKGWGVKTNIVSGKDAETDVKLSPMIITDERGNRRFVNFADENTWVHMQRFNSDMPGNVIIDGNDAPNIHISNDEVNVMINNDKKVDGKEIKSQYNMRKSIVIKHDSSSADGEPDAHKMQMNLVVDDGDGEANNFNMNINFVDSTKDMNVILEEAMKKVQQSLKGLNINFDSAKKALLNIKVDNEFNWNGNMPGFDSMIKDFGKGMKNFKIEMKGFDSSMKNFGKQMNSIMVIDKNYSPEEAAIHDNDQGINLRDLGKELEAVEAKLSAKINTLVPVLVRKSTEVTRNAEENRDYDNGVIMWFEPEYYYKQVDKANGTKQSVQNTTPSSASVVSNTTVYPNPVRTSKTNIHYRLSEARSVAFSIHDILGKKIVDCGSLAERPQGEYDFELNIGSIPAGIYLVVITTDKGEQSIQRIAVEK
jgi:hypothetical protein